MLKNVTLMQQVKNIYWISFVSFNPVSLVKNLMHMPVYFRIAFFVSIVMVVYTAENSVALRLNMYER
jgi:hypothetical protein